MADALMRRERPDHTLQPSALVNEALIRLFDGEVLVRATDRRYLFAAAAQAMRQVLVDHARARAAVKRAGRRERVPLDQVLDYFEERKLDVIALHESVNRLMALDERQGLVVALRFFLGLSVPEVADVLDVSKGTVEGIGGSPAPGSAASLERRRREGSGRRAAGTGRRHRPASHDYVPALASTVSSSDLDARRRRA